MNGHLLISLKFGLQHAAYYIAGEYHETQQR